MNKKMTPDDPAYWMLFDGFESTPVVHNPDCYICNDPEFAQMGLPLCYKCFLCDAHVPADDNMCDAGHAQPMCNEDEFFFEELAHGGWLLEYLEVLNAITR